MTKNTSQKQIDVAYLTDIIKRNDYFQRSVNIGLDKDLTQIIKNFYCPISYEQILVRMTDVASQASQSAFTWIGSYGSGKSSLALFIKALVSSDDALSSLAKDKLSLENRDIITGYFDNSAYDWHVLNLVGKAVSPEQLFKEVLFDGAEVTSQDIFNALTKMIEGNNKLIIFVDELGKTLEAVNRSEQAQDIYFLQQLAEFSNRSKGKLIFIGILHQSFTAYARQAKKQIYHEWLKIQGRFVDCPITLSVDEQLHLVSQVIKIDENHDFFDKQRLNHQNMIEVLVKNISDNKPTDSIKLSQVLSATFPLHPMVAILLCQLSKKEFGQNQRSIFSFLMSAEPYGFGNYLRQTPILKFHIYTLDMFWDYMDSNLGSMILASEHAKTWLLSQMAVSRYQVRNNDVAIRLIKIISLLSLLSDDTGVHANIELLTALLQEEPEKIQTILSELETSGLVFYSKFKQAFLLNEGSDFNLSRAIEEYLPQITQLPFHELKQLNPIIAKRHYQQTGSLRWAEVRLIPLNLGDIESIFHELMLSTDASCVGYLCILVPTNQDDYLKVKTYLPKIIKDYPGLIVTVMEKYGAFVDLLKDALAIKEILKSDNHLLNDGIARQETQARLVDTEDRINTYLQNLLVQSKWYHCLFETDKPLTGFLLSGLVSDIAQRTVHQAIYCHNELVNRTHPSPSAKGAIRELIKRMIENSKQPMLGIEKFPPERAIYESLLKSTGIHRSDDGENFYFGRPTKDSGFCHIWQQTDEFIYKKQGGLVTAKEVYQMWQAPPFGIKAGLCDILYIAYVISRNHDLANYIEEEYKPNLQYLLAEYLLKSPKSVGIREVANLKHQQPWIFKLNQKLQSEFGTFINQPVADEPLPIAQALISVFDRLPSWLHRTNELELTTKQLRNILKQSNDPNKLLFDDLPRFFDVQDNDDQKADKIINALRDMHKKYPDLVEQINSQLFINLKLIQAHDVANINPYDSNLFDIINNRANAIWKKTGDLKLEPFITRLRTYRGTPIEAEGLIGILANNKPAKSWIDQDIHKALQQLNVLSFDFLEAEIGVSTAINDDRYKVSVILKSPNDVRHFEAATEERLKRNAHVVPQNLAVIERVLAQIRSLKDFERLDSNDKIAALAKLFEQLAIEK
ncbi:hypothetical protein [Moraxella canis]|uniref:hypothetical protein n=1 Tax=Moraxella canis TaxID=90239 RepID=UPI00066882D4|nr:hypothetical protein [Moraxella canis]